MYCPKCGKSISDSSDFCMFCGEKIKAHHVIDNTPVFTNREPANDFITLNCPSCGGRLSVNKTMPSLQCNYCGAEHLVRSDANGYFLEAYARCPTCNRNDKSAKASIIFETPKEPDLLQILDSKPTEKLFISIVILILLFIVLIFYVSNAPSVEDGNIYLYCIYPLIGLSLISLVNQIIYAIKYSAHNREIIPENRRIRETNARRRQEFTKNKKVWNEIYYCKRDDTFFSISENKLFTQKEIENSFGNRRLLRKTIYHDELNDDLDLMY